LSKYIAVAIGGALGALARYWIASTVGARFDARFPFSTLIINLSGSFVAGMFLTLALGRVNLHPNWRLAIVVGFLGAYTTFSTLAYESFKLLEERNIIRGFANIIVSMILGLIAVWLGVVAARGIDALIVTLHGPPPHARLDESFSEMEAIAGLPADDETLL
jgi:fluoride exporter